MMFNIDASFDVAGYHTMRTSLSEHGSAVLIWPKDIPVKWLEHAREMVCFQLDTMIEGARRISKKEEVAAVEWTSWFPLRGLAGGGVSADLNPSGERITCGDQTAAPDSSNRH